MAEPTVNLPDTPALSGPAASWVTGESVSGMPAADGGASGGHHPVMDSLGINDLGLKEMTAKLADIDRNKIGKTDEAIAKIDADAARYKPIAESQLAASVRTADTLKAWDADYESAKRKTDPVVAFGSFGSVFGILASAFTHAPMENALNASAAAMNAIHAGDEKAYDRASKAWQDNEALAVKRANLQHAAYQDAISLMQTNAEMGANKLKLEFIKFGDQKNLVLHEAGMDEDVFKNIAAFQKARTGLEESFAGRLRSKQQMSEIMADPRFKLPPGDPKRGEMIREAELRWKQSKNADDEFNRQYLLEHKDDFNSEEYARAYGAFKAGQRSGLSVADQEIFDSWKEKNPAATPEQEAAFRATLGGGRGRQGSQRQAKPEEEAIRARAEKLMQLYPEMEKDAAIKQATREYKKDTRVITANKADDLQGKIDQVKLGRKLVDKIDGLLAKHNMIAGLGGSATRPFEAIANVLGSDATDRKEFQRLVSEMQLIAPQILTGRGGKPLSAEAGKIQTEIAGLSPGDTSANSIRAYFELREQLDFIQENLNLRKNDGDSATPAGKSDDRWWDHPSAGRVKK